MSLINKVLQDLDRRQALATAGDTPSIQVRMPMRDRRGSRGWFWSAIALLALASLAWIGWVGYQLMPRSVATPGAFQAAADASRRPATPPVAVSSPPAPVPVPAAIPAAPALPPPAPQPEIVASQETARATAEPLRAAPPVDTPIVERPQPVPEAPAKLKASTPAAAPKRAEPAKEPRRAVEAPAAKASVDKRDISKSAFDVAEAHFRRAAAFLNQGRISEAEDQLTNALRADPSHHPARQAYVSLLLEQRRVENARRVLAEALAANPSQPTFALALARIHADQRDYVGALEVMDRAGSVARNADFQALRGVVLQRLNRHAEAVDAFQNAVRGGPQQPNTLVALGISLEAVGRKAEAGQAYRRALGTGALAAELKEYAESRARALE